MLNGYVTKSWTQLIAYFFLIMIIVTIIPALQKVVESVTIIPYNKNLIICSVQKKSTF